MLFHFNINSQIQNDDKNVLWNILGYNGMEIDTSDYKQQMDLVKIYTFFINLVNSNHV